MIDELEARTHFLYVLGNEGGPYKIGYTMNLKTRRLDILKDYPGTLHADKSARYWSAIPVASAPIAQLAEQEAHDLLAGWRLHRERHCGSIRLSRWEWFAVHVDEAIRACGLAVETAVASHGSDIDPVWHPISELPNDRQMVIQVRNGGVFRWFPYQPRSQQYRSGVPGRWMIKSGAWKTGHFSADAEWMELTPDIPNRSEAIRRMVRECAARLEAQEEKK